MNRYMCKPKKNIVYCLHSHYVEMWELQSICVFFPLSLYHFSFHLVSLPFTSLPYHHGHMKCCHYSTRCFHTEVLHTTQSFRKNWGDSHTCSHSLEWDELHISDSWEAIDAAPEIVNIFYAPALVISVAGGIMFSVRPSAHPSVRLIIVNAISQERLERTLSHLAQMSCWTQGWTD